MPKRHVVSGGDSVESIAYANGLFWETVWNAAGNAALREAGREPTILHAGDVVEVPDIRLKEVSAATGKRHVYRRRGVPSVLRVQLMECGEPRAGVAYTVEAGERVVKGQADADGWVEVWLWPDVERGVLRLDETGEVFEFDMGTVRPPEVPEGVVARLRNLGYLRKEEGAVEDEALVKAIEEFQREMELAVTGEADAQTCEALEAAHGS